MVYNKQHACLLNHQLLRPESATFAARHVLSLQHMGMAVVFVDG